MEKRGPPAKKNTPSKQMICAGFPTIQEMLDQAIALRTGYSENPPTLAEYLKLVRNRMDGLVNEALVTDDPMAALADKFAKLHIEDDKWQESE